MSILIEKNQIDSSLKGKKRIIKIINDKKDIC